MSLKRKFEVLEEPKDKCFRCDDKFFHVQYTEYKRCNHCFRIFCDKCFSLELESKNPRVFQIYDRNNTFLSQCSLCISCNKEQERKNYVGVIDPFWKSLACISCTPIQGRYDTAITELIEKQYITGLLKLKTEQDYKEQMSKIENNLKILQQSISEIDEDKIKKIRNNKIEKDLRVKKYYMQNGPCPEYNIISAYTPK